MKKFLLMLAAFAFIATPALAQSNEAFIDQANSNNVADVTQTGASNDAAIGQGLLQGWGFVLGATTVFPYAQLDETAGTANNNSASIVQAGSRNATAFMQGAGNDASNDPPLAANNVGTISQDGNRNVAAPGQGTYSGTAVGNTLDIDQTGNDNFAVAAQALESASANGNDSDIDQDGDDNTANTFQGYGAAGNAVSNFARSYQDGDANESLIEQGRDGYAANNEARIFQGMGGPSVGSYAEISQLGTWHWARVDQLGGNHFADIDQIGTNNDAHVTQGN